MSGGLTEQAIDLHNFTRMKFFEVTLLLKQQREGDMTLPLLYKGLTSFVQSRSIAQRQQSRNDILRNTTTPPSADPEIAGSAERAELPALL